MRLLRNLLLSLLVLVLLAGVALWTLPAQLAYRWAAPELGPVRLDDISGTLWDGRAGRLSVFGQALGGLEWRLDKAPLLGGRLRGQLRLSGGQVEASGGVVREPGGLLRASAVDFRLPAALAEPALDIPALHLQGEIVGRLDEAVVRGGWVEGARGQARWTQAGVSGKAEARFGDLLLDFAAQPDGSIKGTVKDDTSSNLAVDGQFVVRAAQFDAQASLSARNEDQTLREALLYIGEPQANGSSLLKIHGQLYKLL